MSYFLAFLASLCYIHLKAAQQLNVMSFDYGRIMPTSMGMAFCEVFIMVNIVRTADSVQGLILLAICIGVGAGLGCISAMKLHQRRKCASD